MQELGIEKADKIYSSKMKKSRKRLSEYWDNLILKFIPPYAKFNKLEEEIKEHFNFLGIMFKRIILPLILIYVLIALILNLNIFGSLFISLLIFLYSNFLPDSDFLVKRANKHESLWYERYTLMFFLPLVFYYVILGKAKPIISKKARCFHNIESALVWAIFLFVIGNIFWNESLKIIMFTSFGFIGYCLHLLVDGTINFEKILMRKAHN